MNQADLAATLLGQLGLDHSSFNFSRNVLGSDYTYPFAFIVSIMALLSVTVRE